MDDKTRRQTNIYVNFYAYGLPGSPAKELRSRGVSWAAAEGCPIADTIRFLDCKGEIDSLPECFDVKRDQKRARS